MGGRIERIGEKGQKCRRNWQSPVSLSKFGKTRLATALDVRPNKADFH